MSNIIDVEYREVMPLEDKSINTLATEANEWYARAESVATVSMMMLVETGKRLRIIKERVGHGGWGDWVKENLNFSQKKATRLMNLAERNEEEGGLFSNLSTLTNIEISKVWALLEAPEEAAKEVLETESIEDMTVKNLQEELKRIKAENKALSEASESEKQEAQRLQSTVEMLRADLRVANLEKENAEEKLAAAPDSSELQEALELSRRETSELEKKLAEAEHETKGMKARLVSEREALKQKAAEETKAAAEKAEKEAQGRIDAKVEEAIADALKDADGEIDTLKKEIDRLQKLSDPATGEFKAHVDSLQQEFNACLNAIDKAAEENVGKWRMALKKIIEAMEGQL